MNYELKQDPRAAKLGFSPIFIRKEGAPIHPDDFPHGWICKTQEDYDAACDAYWGALKPRKDNAHS